MAGSFTDAMEVEQLKIATGQATSIVTTTPITPYVALCTSAPSDSAAGTEVANSNNYARTSSASKWGAPTSGSPSSVANNATITFPTPSGSWGTITHFEIWDSGTYGSGNRLAWGALATSKTPTSGDTVSFASGALTITQD